MLTYIYTCESEYMHTENKYEPKNTARSLWVGGFLSDLAEFLMCYILLPADQVYSIGTFSKFDLLDL